MKTTRREALKRAAAVVAASVAVAPVAVGRGRSASRIDGRWIATIALSSHCWTERVDQPSNSDGTMGRFGLGVVDDRRGNVAVSQVTGPSPHEVSGRMIESGIGEEWLLQSLRPRLRIGHKLRASTGRRYAGDPFNGLEGWVLQVPTLPVGGLFRPVSDAASTDREDGAGDDVAALMATKLTAPIYRSRAWQALRAEALRRAGWRCSRCGGYSREVHHRVPVAQGGPAIPGLTGVACSLQRLATCGSTIRNLKNAKSFEAS